MPNALVWFRNDLRLSDNPALRAGLDAGQAPVCVYIHAPEEEGAWPPGAASNAWRHGSLAALDADLRARGSRLRLFAGPSLATLRTLALAFDAVAVYWNRRYEPAAEQRDAAVKAALRSQGLRVESFNGSLLFEPWEVRTKSGTPYRVFTPFWRALRKRWTLEPTRDPPRHMRAVERGPEGVLLEALHLRSAHAPPGMREWWTPGEAGAQETLEVFVDGALRGYREGRDRPDRAATSRLSPHLHFGEIAPWRVAAALEAQRTAATSADIDAFLRELGWREFAHHLLHHFPESTDAHFDRRFDRFRWAPDDPARLDAWRRGATGVPIIDAGMRELRQTGWMHNRVRMIAGSFLTRHLRQHWLQGARWFWETLVDADLANNTLGWQWIAGTGADAAPYFRVFNPVAQARRCDPDGAYIARWVPELARLPLPARFAPWSDPTLRPAAPYPPQPIVDLAQARELALAAYRHMTAAARER